MQQIRSTLFRQENNRNAVAVVVVVVVVVERKLQYQCGGGGGGKTIEMWWWWSWGRKTIEFYGLKTVKCATFYLFLSLFRSVLSTKTPWVEEIVCKGTWCLNTAMLVSPHFKQFQYFHRNVSGFASSTLSPPWLPEWPGPEKRPGFDRYCNKLQRPFTLPRRGSFGVIHNGSQRIHKC